MKRIITIDGVQGAGKSEVLAIINGSLTGSVLWVDGNSTAKGIIQALRGREGVTILIDECTQQLLAEFDAIVPDSDVWKRISCIYAAMVPAVAPRIAPGVVQLPGGMDGAVYVVVPPTVAREAAKADAAWQMREEFEAWQILRRGHADKLKDGTYHCDDMQEQWNSWQASRAAVVVELPAIDDPDCGQRVPFHLGAYKGQCRQAIEAAGLRVAK